MDNYARSRRGLQVARRIQDLTRQQQQDLETAALRRQVLAAIRERQARGELPRGDREAAQALSTMTAQRSANEEIVRFAQQLGPSDLQAIEQAWTIGGPEALGRLLAPHLSAEAMTVLDATLVDAGGTLEGLVQRVSGHVEAAGIAETRAQVAARYEATDEDDAVTRLIKERSPLAAALRPDGPANDAAAALLAERGLTPEPGRSAAETVTRLLLAGVEDGGEDALDAVNIHRTPGDERIERPEALKHFAELFKATPAEVRELLDATDEVYTRHGLTARLAKRDAEVKARPAPKSTPEEIRRDRVSRSTRSALEARYDALEAKDRAKDRAVHEMRTARAAPEASTASTPAASPAAAPEDNSIRANLERAYDAIDSAPADEEEST